MGIHGLLLVLVVLIGAHSAPMVEVQTSVSSPATTASPASQAGLEKWTTKRDRLADGSETVLLSAMSGPTFDYYGKKEAAALVLRSRAKELDIYLVTPAIIGTEAVISFDDEPPTRYATTRSADYKGIFVGSPAEFLKRLLRHRSVRFRVSRPPFEPAEVAFTLDGLPGVVAPLLAAAGLPPDLAVQPLRPGKWLLQGENTPVPSVELISEGSVRIGTTDERATLVLVCRDRKLEAYIKTASPISKPEVWVEFDGGRRRKQEMAWGRTVSMTPTAGLSVFFPDALSILEALIPASTMTVGLGRPEGPMVSFDVAHLAEVVGPLRTACRIK